MTVFTSLRIPLNFEGVTNEIGRYPFAKILIADVCTCSNTRSNGVNLMNLHTVI